MTQYRLLYRKDDAGKWHCDGVAYTEDEHYLFYRRGQTMRQQVASLDELGDVHFPYETGSEFHWGSLEEWRKTEPFTPTAVLRRPSVEPRQTRRSPRYRSADEIPSELRRYLLDINLLWSEQ
jgi:hypothetical protein